MKLRNAGAVLALILVAGCGGESDGMAMIGGLARTLAPGLAPGDEAERQAASQAATVELSAAIAADPTSVIAVQINALGIAEPARRVIDNDGRSTWAGASGYTVAYDDGMLVATRGLIDDLMAADTSQSRAALRQGGGRAKRVHEMLDDRDRIVRAEFDCVIEPEAAERIDLGARQVEARRFHENCEGSALIFDNYYWLDPQGGILASRQFVTQTVAYLRSNRL